MIKTLKYTKVIIFFSLFLLGLSSCSLTKYVPEDRALVNRIKIKDNNTELSNKEVKNFVLQRPNSMMLGFMRFKLATYSLSGQDTTKWINRFLRKIGEKPVVLDSNLMYDSQYSIQQGLKNKGYLDSYVSTKLTVKNKKGNIEYLIQSGDLYKIRYLYFDLYTDIDSIYDIVNEYYTVNSLDGQNFDIDRLNDIREKVSHIFRIRGYYNVKKEIFSFQVDSTALSQQVDLRLTINDQYNDSSLVREIFTKKYINNITIYCFDGVEAFDKMYDTVYIGGYTIIYNSKRHIFKPKFLADKLLIQSGQLYDERLVNRTLSNFTSLLSTRYIDISFTESYEDRLDCSIHVYPADKYAYSIGLDANTNSGATIGAGINLGFTDKNIFRGSEILKINFRGSYDMYRKNYSGYKHAFTLGGDASIVFPKLLVPFFNSDLRLRSGAFTQVYINYTYQAHPDFKRSIANTSFSYKWQKNRSVYDFTLADLSYIKIDTIAEDFLFRNPNLRPTFEDHLVLKMVFNYSKTNNSNQFLFNKNYYFFRGRVSVGGNLFYGINQIFSRPRYDGQYYVFKTPFSQFIKVDFDYSYNTFISKRTRLVFHTMFGIGIPYANARILPFEERFFAGGSNSMRGWGARMLGPGSFYSSKDNFLVQNGDIKLEFNAEARVKMFWVLEGAFFIDAGNVWTIKKYKGQDNGYFSMKDFKSLQDIAINYGLGLRFDFNYFVIRFDFGVKLYDPRYKDPSQRWAINKNFGGGKANRIDVIISPQFAIGYPF